MVCREYCAETYNQALDRAGIPADSELRRVDQVYYPKDLRENITAPPPPAALPPPPPEQSLTIQEPSQGAELPTGAKKREKGGSGGLSDRRKSEGEGEGENKE